MFTSKKAQSLSIHTIVIAALALLVLAVVALILFNGLNKASTQVNACTSGGGVCVDSIRGSPSCAEYADDNSAFGDGKYAGKLSKDLDLNCASQKKICCLFI